MQTLRGFLGPMKVPFLILTPACVLLGTGAAAWSDARLSLFEVVLVLVGAVAAHISVNALNEYVDFRSGLDLRTQPTPFSGGSGTLRAHPELAQTALATGVAALLVAAVVGLYFVWLRGTALLPLGVLGLIVIVAYTPLITQNPLICLIAPGLGFGPLMVVGTYVALTGQYSWPAFVASLVPFFLVDDLLLLNQFPDAQPDSTVGRKHVPIVLGRKNSSLVYALFLAAAYVALVAGVLSGLLPPLSLLGLVTVLAAIPAARGAYRYAENMKKLVPFMSLNVLVNILTPVLIAVGLFAS